MNSETFMKACIKGEPFDFNTFECTQDQFVLVSGLRIATEHGHTALVHKILKEGNLQTFKYANLNESFRIACKYGNIQIVKLFLEHAKDQCDVNDGLFEAMDCLIQNHCKSFLDIHYEFAQFLIDRGTCLYESHVVCALNNSNYKLAAFILNRQPSINLNVINIHF